MNYNNNGSLPINSNHKHSTSSKQKVSHIANPFIDASASKKKGAFSKYSQQRIYQKKAVSPTATIVASTKSNKLKRSNSRLDNKVNSASQDQQNQEQLVQLMSAMPEDPRHKMQREMKNRGFVSIQNALSYLRFLNTDQEAFKATQSGGNTLISNLLKVIEQKNAKDSNYSDATFNYAKKLSEEQQRQQQLEYQSRWQKSPIRRQTALGKATPINLIQNYGLQIRDGANNNNSLTQSYKNKKHDFQASRELKTAEDKFTLAQSKKKLNQNRAIKRIMQTSLAILQKNYRYSAINTNTDEQQRSISTQLNIYLKQYNRILQQINTKELQEIQRGEQLYYSNQDDLQTIFQYTVDNDFREALQVMFTKDKVSKNNVDMMIEGFEEALVALKTDDMRIEFLKRKTLSASSPVMRDGKSIVGSIIKRQGIVDVPGGPIGGSGMSMSTPAKVIKLTQIENVEYFKQPYIFLVLTINKDKAKVKEYLYLKFESEANQDKWDRALYCCFMSRKMAKKERLFEIEYPVQDVMKKQKQNNYKDKETYFFNENSVIQGCFGGQEQLLQDNAEQDQTGSYSHKHTFDSGDDKTIKISVHNAGNDDLQAKTPFSRKGNNASPLQQSIFGDAQVDANFIGEADGGSIPNRRPSSPGRIKHRESVDKILMNNSTSNQANNDMNKERNSPRNLIRSQQFGSEDGNIKRSSNNEFGDRDIQSPVSPARSNILRDQNMSQAGSQKNFENESNLQGGGSNDNGNNNPFMKLLQISQDRREDAMSSVMESTRRQTQFQPPIGSQQQPQHSTLSETGQKNKTAAYVKRIRELQKANVRGMICRKQKFFMNKDKILFFYEEKTGGMDNDVGLGSGPGMGLGTESQIKPEIGNVTEKGLDPSKSGIIKNNNIQSNSSNVHNPNSNTNPNLRTSSPPQTSFAQNILNKPPATTSTPNTRNVPIPSTQQHSKTSQYPNPNSNINNQNQNQKPNPNSNLNQNLNFFLNPNPNPHLNPNFRRKHIQYWDYDPKKDIKQQRKLIPVDSILDCFIDKTGVLQIDYRQKPPQLQTSQLQSPQKSESSPPPATILSQLPLGLQLSSQLFSKNNAQTKKQLRLIFTNQKQEMSKMIGGISGIKVKGGDNSRIKTEHENEGGNIAERNRATSMSATRLKPQELVQWVKLVQQVERGLV